ncbi:hypothetical protein [Nocardioides sp. Iso805N]|uniref:hypothetical protein n=1 Tax=Nocardioides sp. Iso805N TaxID=1283287 RepID=UPI00037B7649|nr:hypothetical protein [Nocardioides sp. Iso805N]
MPACRKHRYATRVDALIVLARIQHRDSTTRPKTEKRAYLLPQVSLLAPDQRTAPGG